MRDFSRWMKLSCTCDECFHLDIYEGDSYVEVRRLARHWGWIMGRDGDWCSKACWQKARAK
jgi:hypothetical protein